jgi:hypothetical protein
MQELVPIVTGFAAGLALGYLRPSLRLPVGALLAVVLGVAATFVTGESAISWAFVLIDVPLVALAASCGVLVARRVRPRTAGAG